MKHIQFLRTLKRLCFSGQLTLTDSSGQTWLIYLSQGHIVYATGGVHPVRRWQRNLKRYCAENSLPRVLWQHDLAKIVNPSSLGWEYDLLSVWLAQQKISEKQAKKIISATVVEVLFDLAQADDLTEQVNLDTSFSSESLFLIEVERAVVCFQKAWKAWQGASLAHISPNQSLVIREPEKFHNRKFAQFYHAYVKLLNGEHTLHDLSIKTQRDVVQMTSKLLPLIHLGWIQLTDIPDLHTPRYRQTMPKSEPPVTSITAGVGGGLIACVDDSIRIHRVMEKLLTAAGYQFLGIDDAMRAIGTLLKRKPELVFLDLVMPQASGYEICKQLRKLPSFRTVPIVILTGNDGFANRLHSNFAGASDFLSKPLNAEKVLGVIDKHLNKQGVA